MDNTGSIEFAHIILLFTVFVLMIAVLNKHFRTLILPLTILGVMTYVAYIYTRGSYMPYGVFIVLDIIVLVVVLYCLRYYILAHKLKKIEVVYPENNWLVELALKTGMLYELKDNIDQDTEKLKQDLYGKDKGNTEDESEEEESEEESEEGYEEEFEGLGIEDKNKE